MVYNSSYTKFATKQQREYTTDVSSKLQHRKWVEEKVELAETLTKFGGKRLLGVTENNQPIYVRYNIDKDTLDIKISLTHSMDTIRKSKLCPRRVVGSENESIDIKLAMRPASKTDHGEVTQRTLDYIEKLIDKSETDYYRVNGKCSSLLFMYISNCIYGGSHEPGKVRWMDISKGWNLPSGEYFTVDG